ncbi:MAG: carboxypeptidase regulatory-like domain-containing protein, partial [Thermoanaerobaculia bacterium]|nr:carboxypeptidase regulatory-like domain-containing protein [Thermoanaerobaculia bacterium]
MAFGQQTGVIQGEVTTADGTPLPGVTVEASSNVLPQARVVTTSVSGEYRFPALPPGDYLVEFNLAGMETQTRNVKVFLNQDTFVNVQMGIEQVAETITVVAETPFIDKTSTAIKSAVGNEAIEKLPVGQDYDSLIKLIPAVQYEEFDTRGPSAGGSGQDNVYEFDGVDVTLPQYGTLSAEPSNHDIEQISIVKGGAKAIDFNRAGGFSIDSVSKSGTNEWSGRLSYQIQSEGMRGDLDTGTDLEFEEDRDWATVGIGGPIARDLAYFYGSYYRPTRERDNQANLYGELPKFESVRDEFFGKVTLTPTSAILLHGSYRDSETDQQAGTLFGEAVAPTTAVGFDSTLGIAIVEGSWLISDNSYATFKYSDFENKNSSRPDNLLDFNVRFDGS